VLQMALREKGNRQRRPNPEREYIEGQKIKVAGQKALRLTAMFTCALIAAGGLAAVVLNRKRLNKTSFDI